MDPHGINDPVLELEGVTRRYGRRDTDPTLGPCDLTLRAGTVTALVGRSGSGKSTVLNCAAGLSRVTDGVVRYLGEDITRLPDRRLARLRRDDFGFVFQDYTLIDALTVAENIALPARMSRRTMADDRVGAVAEGLGIGPWLGQPTARLSGGQRQRVAIARAVANDARVLFADEPTGALDPLTRDEVLSVLLDPGVRAARAVLIATHDVPLACAADRVLVIDGGRVAAVLDAPTPGAVLEALRSTGSAA